MLVLHVELGGWLFAYIISYVQDLKTTILQ